MKQRLRSISLISLVFLFMYPYFSCYAQPSFQDQMKMQTVLERIDARVEDFVKRFTGYYDLQTIGEGKEVKYTGPVRQKDPLEDEEAAKANDLIPPFIRIKQYPTKEANL